MQQITLKQVAPFIILATIATLAIFAPTLPLFSDAGNYNSADISWMIMTTALVFLMTPGLAFFYGGMVYRKNVISILIKRVVVVDVVCFLCVIVIIHFNFCYI